MVSVFHKTYDDYMEQIRCISFARISDKIGGEIKNDGLEIPFLNERYRITQKGITSLEGDDTTFAVKVILCKYVLMSGEPCATLSTELVSFRDFKDSGPLLTYFANNTNKTLEEQFGDNLEALRKRAKLIGGKENEFVGYDLSISFRMLPKITIILNFNTRDDEFPAASSILFRRNAEQYLDMECLAMCCTYLAGRLVA